MRYNVLATVALLPLQFAAPAVAALADEQSVTLAQSGDWIAKAHSASMTAPPDVCVAANIARGVVFRAEDGLFQVRIVDKSWSLPSDVKGSVTISVGDWKGTFDIDANTDTIVVAEPAEDDTTALFRAMDRASTMTVAVGRSKPFAVSLIGSTKAMNAFRTCAGLQGNNPSPGSNPF